METSLEYRHGEISFSDDLLNFLESTVFKLIDYFEDRNIEISNHQNFTAEEKHYVDEFFDRETAYKDEDIPEYLKKEFFTP